MGFVWFIFIILIQRFACFYNQTNNYRPRKRQKQTDQCTNEIFDLHLNKL